MIALGIVDDHSVLRDALTFCLNNQKDIEITISACNGRDLLNKLQFASRPPDIILLDYVMPIMNGKEVMVYLKKHYPTIKIIILTALVHDHTILEAFKLGAKGFLIKGCSMDILIESIKRVKKNESIFFEDENTLTTYKIDKQKINLLPTLSKRQVEFLKLCSDGALSYKQMATMLGLSLNTIHRYREELFKKLELNSRTALAIYAVQTGIANL